jgi:hypothetical protein
MEFTHDGNLPESTVFDLMSIIANHHGESITLEKIQILIPTSSTTYKQITDLSTKLRVLGDVSEFYYDFAPVSGALLIITS